MFRVVFFSGLIYFVLEIYFVFGILFFTIDLFWLIFSVFEIDLFIDCFLGFSRLLFYFLGLSDIY